MIESSNQLYSGTIVTKGRGYMKVTATGMNTKFGQIAHSLATIEDTKTPLQIKLISLTRFIGIAGIIAAVIVFIISFIEGTGYFPAFLLAISLAVAVVPEGLPAVMTITLSIGVKKMAQKKAIIRKLAAIEALGSITLIATDKTGTLTTNKMKVKEISSRHERELLLNGILCSTASLVYVRDHGRWDVLGDPTEGALLYLAQDRGLDVEAVRKEWKIIDEKPFDSVTKTMSVIVQNVGAHHDAPVQFVKGAPESILSMVKISDKQKAEAEKQVEKWASRGLRVLAFAYKNQKSEVRSQIADDRRQKPDTTDSLVSDFRPPTSDLTFLGLVAIHDAPRPEVTDAVKKAKEAGIKVVMITGDNEKTAEAVGIMAGIIKYGDEILNGGDIDKFSDEELLRILPKVRIFSRTNPFQKHRIVKLYQKLGEIVAVTGDGVNDAIALKQADVGVAMGLVGTDVARETADMVITDDNFATIVNAVEEGRNIIKNLKNAIKYLLSCNMTEAISLIVGLIMGLPTLFYAIQLLYINLVTDGLPALSLAFSPKNPRVMQEKPAKEMTLLAPFDIKFIVTVGILGTVLVLGGHFAGVSAFSILALIQSFILIELWLSHQSLRNNFRKLLQPIFLAAFIFPFIAQYIIVTFSYSANLFKTVPLTFMQYLQAAFVSSLVLIGTKGIKMLLK